MRAFKEINLQSLNDEQFAAICHAVLLEEHSSAYQPVAGEGGDSGIDGFLYNYEIVYQFKFFKARPRPSAFLKDIDKVAHLPNLKQWILLIPEDPTQRLYELISKEKALRSFNIDVLGKTWVISKLDKHKNIRERFFPEIAKEESVQKVININEFKARKHEKILKNHEKLLKEIKKETISKRPIRPSVERPYDSLTPEHIRLIKDEIKRLEKSTDGKQSFNKVCSVLKNKYGVANWFLIKDDQFSEIMDWLRRYYFATKEKYRAPGDIRHELIGVIKAQQKRLALRDNEYRALLFRLTGKDSSTRMEIHELRFVIDHFNLLMGINK